MRFLTVLAGLFSADLDRKTLWARIGSALEAADAKAGGDAERFLGLCLDHVKADWGRAAACEALGAVLGTLTSAAPEDRAAFLAYLRDHKYPALVFARQRWGPVKAGEVEL